MHNKQESRISSLGSGAVALLAISSSMRGIQALAAPKAHDFILASGGERACSLSIPQHFNKNQTLLALPMHGRRTPSWVGRKVLQDIPELERNIIALGKEASAAASSSEGFSIQRGMMTINPRGKLAFTVAAERLNISEARRRYFRSQGLIEGDLTMRTDRTPWKEGTLSQAHGMFNLNRDFFNKVGMGYAPAQVDAAEYADDLHVQMWLSVQAMNKMVDLRGLWNQIHFARNGDPQNGAISEYDAKQRLDEAYKFALEAGVQRLIDEPEYANDNRREWFMVPPKK